MRDILTVQCVGHANVPTVKGPWFHDTNMLAGRGAPRGTGAQTERLVAGAAPAQGQPAEHRADDHGLVLPAASSPSCRHPPVACFLPQGRPVRPDKTLCCLLK